VDAARRRRPLGPRVGLLPQRDGRFAAAALPPLGRLDAATAQALAALAPAVRIGWDRSLAIVDLDRAAAESTAAALAALGLVTDAGSGWIGLSACAGLGACGRAQVDVRAAAAARAAERSPRHPLEHWVACERACGRPPGAELLGADDAARLLATSAAA
jgi:sulfite reductase beta subunit-like hemoprotein